MTLLGQGVGLGDPQRSLPTPNILEFCIFIFPGAIGKATLGVSVRGGQVLPTPMLSVRERRQESFLAAVLLC